MDDVPTSGITVQLHSEGVRFRNVIMEYQVIKGGDDIDPYEVARDYVLLDRVLHPVR